MASDSACAQVTSSKSAAAIPFASRDRRLAIRDRRAIGLFMIPAAMGAFELYNSLSVRAQPHGRALYAVVVVVAAAFTAMTWRGTSLPARARSITVGFLLITPLHLFVTLFQPHWLPVYVVGDFFVLVLPLIFLYAMFALPGVLSSPMALGLLAAFLFLAALNAHLFGATYGRSDPPSVLLIAMCWVAALRRSGPWWSRCIGVIAAAVVGYLAFTSGYRTHVVLWVLAAPFVCIVLRGLKVSLVAALAAITGILWLSMSDYAANLNNQLGSSRFRTVLSGDEDASLQNRIAEVRDVLSTASEQWYPGQFVIGSGFGATYRPQRVIIKNNLNDRGTVHHVHIGPIMVFFRYGLVGSIVLAALVFVVMSSIANARRMALSRSMITWPAIFSSAAGLYLVNFLLRNSTVEPTMAFSVAAVLYLWCAPVTPRVVVPGGSMPGGITRSIDHAK